MDYYETIKYSKKTTNDKIGKANRVRFEPCNQILTKDECESTLPLKYYTTNFFTNPPCENSNLTNLTRGINFSIPGGGHSIDDISKDSQLRIGKFNEKKYCGRLDPFPVQAGSHIYGAVVDPFAEDQYVRNQYIRSRPACNPKESNYYERFFPVWTEQAPNPFLDSSCFVQCGPEFRQGISVKGSLSKNFRDFKPLNI